jgi:pyruvate formate lyase activating enzyme
MKIKYVEKSTFIDYPGKSSCIVFLFGCPFRCGFCYNPGLVLQEESEDLSQEKILSFLEKRKGILDAVVFTGGEALMTLDIEFVRRVKKMGYLVKIDINGMFPELLKEFIDEGLVDYVAMDIKGSREKYSEIVGMAVPIDKIEESMLLAAGLPGYEFRTTVVPGIHDDKMIKEIGEWVVAVLSEKPRKYFLQCFQNNGNFIDDKFSKEKNLYPEDLVKMKEAAEDYFLNVGLRG